MEDLWSSPWAADSSAKLDEFPAAPQTVHFSMQQHPHHALPRKISQNLNLSPWTDDDNNNDDHNNSNNHNAWGGGIAGEGWNHAISNGGHKTSSVWSKSPALRPLDTGLQRQPSPDPWREVELDRSQEGKVDEARVQDESGGGSREMEAQEKEGKEEMHTLGDEGLKKRDLTAEPVLKLDLEKQDAWTAEEEPESGSGSGSGSASLERCSISEETFAGLESDSHSIVEQEAEKPPPVQVESEATSPSSDAGSINANDGAEPAAAVPEPPLPQAVVAQPGISFAIDFAALDTLFPTTAGIDTAPEPVPDVIIDSSFTTMSERKTWYRISRYGSSRKHDSGEDENYMRVSWAASEVRDRTLNTVRRWMEEDAASGGRVLLGRGRAGASSGASMFNWDSKAPPVEISELLSGRGKRAMMHGRHASVINMPPRGAPLSSSSAPAKKRPVSMIQLGGNISSPHSIKSPPPLQPIEPLSPYRMASAVHSPHTTSPIRPSNLKTVKMAEDSTSESESEAESEDDDDDEWGEMVGTPTVEADNAIIPFETPVTATPPPPPMTAMTTSKPISSTKPIPSRIHTNLDPVPPSSSSLSTPLWDLDLLEETWGSSAPSPKVPPSMTPSSFSAGHATPTTPTSKFTGDTYTSSSAHAFTHKHTLSPLKYPPPPSLAQETSATSPPTPTSLSLEEDDVDMDLIVASIVHNLPDLTYMLR